MKRTVFLLTMTILGMLVGWQVSRNRSVSFENLSRKEMVKRVIVERDMAIEKATGEGVYKCCIHPACTMCFMEANKWNNFETGTCACDDLIAEGKEPCPQCKNGLCEKSEEGVCKINKLGENYEEK